MAFGKKLGCLVRSVDPLPRRHVNEMNFCLGHEPSRNGCAIDPTRGSVDPKKADSIAATPSSVGHASRVSRLAGKQCCDSMIAHVEVLRLDHVCVRGDDAVPCHQNAHAAELA